MKIAFSPCPNDTFVFHALVHGLISGAPKLEVTYADIDITNSLATSDKGPDIIKISYAALPWVSSEYQLLPCGGALGKGCGPLVLTGNKLANSTDPGVLTGKKVAVPSERSTAYLLFRFWAEQQVPGNIGQIVVLPFQQIMPAVRDGLVDAGLVIHEARFTYPAYGLNLLADLGSWWETETNLPIPLGAIMARKSLDLAAITGWIRASVQYAWQHPTDSQEYVLAHAQELSPAVAQSHIKLYVNQFTENIGDVGYRAVTTLLNRGAEAGLVPKVDLDIIKLQELMACSGGRTQ